ncbi:hypothetical protein RMCBS344292_00111 [Rhizopus microsporus]|nr:hypothetical protein RMCBS344292_00111 [Rhizopus microsporus]
MTYFNRQIALANSNRNAIIEFHGYEGEDFRHFQEVLESYLGLNNVTNEARKLAILKAQLRGPAKIYYEKELVRNNPDITFDLAIAELKSHYITPELIQNYELEFNEMYQGEQEHSRVFLARLREAADLAEINNETIIESRFCAGLLREIKQLSIQSSSKTLKDWLNHAEGWWNANRPRKIAIKLQHHHAHNNYNYNIELVDAAQPTVYITPVNRTLHSNQLITMDTSGRHTQYNQFSPMDVSDRHVQYNAPYPNNRVNNQQELVELIQQTIRLELNNQRQQPNRNYNRYSCMEDMNNNNADYGNDNYRNNRNVHNG